MRPESCDIRSANDLRLQWRHFARSKLEAADLVIFGLMLLDTFERIQCKVQSGEVGVAPLQLPHNMERVNVMVKARYQALKLFLARMSKRCMPQVVRQCDGAS